MILNSKRSVKVFEPQDAQSRERKKIGIIRRSVFRYIRGLRIIQQKILQQFFETNIEFYIRPRIVADEKRKIFLCLKINKSKKSKYETKLE